MVRKIIEINEELCNGCSLCASACHEGAIEMQNGKAVLVRDDYCDGLGDCLPVCPTRAITFVEREAAAYDHAAVERNKAQKAETPAPLACGCPGTHEKTIERPAAMPAPSAQGAAPSELTNWPVQLRLANPAAPYFKNAKLLVAADCTAYAYGNIHGDFIRGRVALIGCPKLDPDDYAEKLGEILAANDIESLTVVKMEVPCCNGIADAAKRALQASGKMIPWRVVTVTTDGQLIEE